MLALFNEAKVCGPANSPNTNTAGNGVVAWSKKCCDSEILEEESLFCVACHGIQVPSDIIAGWRDGTLFRLCLPLCFSVQADLGIKLCHRQTQSWDGIEIGNLNGCWNRFQGFGNSEWDLGVGPSGTMLSQTPFKPGTSFRAKMRVRPLIRVVRKRPGNTRLEHGGTQPWAGKPLANV